MEPGICIECAGEVDEQSGWETSSGLVLCGACYAALHGVKAARRFHRPASTENDGASRLFWLTGKNGEVIRTTAFRIAGDRQNA